LVSFHLTHLVFISLNIYVCLDQVSSLGTATCTNVTFEAAQKDFVERLGLSFADYNWKDASKFANMIFEVYAKRSMVVGSRPEESSFVTVCRWEIDH
jgi:hypothetical protein